MSTGEEERRSRSRITINGKMQYRLEGSTEVHQAELEDLSEQGARIWLYQDVPPNSKLYCRIDSDDPLHPAVELTVSIRRKHAQKKDSLFGYGCIIEGKKPAHK